MVFCHGNGKVLNFACPEARAFSVEPFPYQRKAPNAVKEACHCGMSAAYTKAQTGQDIRPGWEGNAIAKRLVACGVCTLSVALAVFSYPCAYVCPTVRKALQAFTFQRGKTADGQPFGVNHAVKVLLIRHPLSPPAFRAVRVSMTCPPFQYWYISSFHSLRHNHRRRLSEFRSLGGSFHIDSFHT